MVDALLEAERDTRPEELRIGDRLRWLRRSYDVVGVKYAATAVVLTIQDPDSLETKVVYYRPGCFVAAEIDWEAREQDSDG